jgi:hypothetical protein
MRAVWKVAALAAVLLLVIAPVRAQELANIAGTVKDASGAVLPGVTVEASSPVLIEKVRSTTTDSNGQYRIAGLPVGTYDVSFSLANFSTQKRSGIALTSSFTAGVDATMSVGNITETIAVQATAPVVDTQNVRQATVFTGDDLKELPAVRNVSTLLNLVPGISFQTGVLNAAAGVCIGGVGTWCSPNAYAFNSHTSMLDTDGLRQGRLMVDGMVLNTASNPITGSAGGYIADVTNAQEVSISISGALGESETGGTSINIVPRTGGNRYAGNFFVNYARLSWFDHNDGNYTNPETGASPGAVNNVIEDHDVTFGYGGPIRRDRLWFYAVARTQGKEAYPGGGVFYPNKNAGIWGMNYQPDRTQDRVTYTNMWRNANGRITWQASRRDKINFFYDEQDSCQDPCDGTVAAYWSPEAMWSVWTYPNRLGQVSWTNPYNNKVLLEAGVNVVYQQYNFDKHRYYDTPTDIPQLNETGDTSGLDEVATRVNQSAGGVFSALRSGSIASANTETYNNDRARFSASYVTGRHQAKMGWEGAWYAQKQLNITNTPRLTYNYSTPGATCYNAASPAASTCGNTSLHFPSDPFNSVRRPVPTSASISTGDRTIDERVGTQSVYAQDQWTLGRFTLNGAIRYDYANSHYLPTCVGPDIYVATRYCTNEADGVSFHDVTPRWSAAWDVFGDGKTAIKWNMGKYLAAAGFQDVFNGANAARRTQNTLTRNWSDTDGDRIVDCDWRNQLAHTNLGDTCGATNGGAQTFRRFGRDPLSLDEAGDAIGLQTSHCGRSETGIPQAVLDYCGRSGQNLLDGWGKRRSEWQFGLGVQRELIPRLSAEVTYNQRWYQNQLVTDTLGVGCDLYAADTEACINGFLNRQANAQYSFYSLRAPVDPRLPNGGGYLINGLDNQNTAAGFSGPEAITRQGGGETYPYIYGWKGVDTNFVYRARGGLRINGGTSTGHSYRDTCGIMDEPAARQREGAPTVECEPYRPWQTNVRGSVAYTIPWIDVLASMTYQSRPGVERSANVTYTYRDVIWAPGSESRATNTVGCPTTGTGAAPVGCLYGTGLNNNNFSVNVLDASDLWGERISYADVKFAKNFRFANRRLNVGVDIYNITNSDAITSYNSTYTIDNPATAVVEPNLWGNPTGLIPPRFAKVTVQFDF